MIWRGPMVQSALQQMLGDVLWGELDVLVVDMPPGTGDAQLTMAQKVPLAGAVIVSTPQDIALLDARKAINMFRKVDVPVLGIVENMSYFCCPNCGHRTEIFAHGGARACAAKYGVDFLAEIPLDIEVRETSDDGPADRGQRAPPPDRRGLSPAGADGAGQARRRAGSGRRASSRQHRLQLSAGRLRRLSAASTRARAISTAWVRRSRSWSVLASPTSSSASRRSWRAASTRDLLDRLGALGQHGAALLVDLGEAAGRRTGAGRPCRPGRPRSRPGAAATSAARGWAGRRSRPPRPGSPPCRRRCWRAAARARPARTPPCCRPCPAPQSAASFLALSTASSMPPTM